MNWVCIFGDVFPFDGVHEIQSGNRVKRLPVNAHPHAAENEKKEHATDGLLQMYSTNSCQCSPAIIAGPVCCRTGVTDGGN